MTKAEQLRALADRCEAASGEDREIDFEIACAVSHVPLNTVFKDNGAWDGGLGYTVRRYTESVDRALELLLNGWTLVHLGGPFHSSNSAATVAGGSPITFCEGAAATPTLALCAASLRALAEKEEK